MLDNLTVNDNGKKYLITLKWKWDNENTKNIFNQGSRLGRSETCLYWSNGKILVISFVRSLLVDL